MYPGFADWFWGKVVPGLGRTRRIFRVGPVSQPAALAIAKLEGGEAKICTLWVSPTERESGHGRALFGEAIQWLGVERPLFTVPEERLAEFAPLLSRFSFKRTASIESLYRAGSVEHVFNGASRVALRP
jgi:hypothetical protein